MSQQAQKQRKIQKSKDNKAMQKDAMKSNKKEYIATLPVPSSTPKEVKQDTKPVPSKANRHLKKYDDKEINDDMFAAFKVAKPIKPNPTDNDEKTDKTPL